MARDNRPLPPPANNVYALKVLGRIEGQVTVTTFHYDDTLPIGDVARTNAPLLYELFVAIAGPYLKLLDCLSADWKAEFVTIDSPTFPSMAPLVFEQTEPGTAPQPHLPTQMAASLIKRTVFKGQCGRGRWALPAVPVAWTVLSQVTTPDAYRSFGVRATQVLTGQGIQFTPILFSKNGSKLHPGQGVAGLISVDLNPTLGTSRRRKLGVGI